MLLVVVQILKVIKFRFSLLVFITDRPNNIDPMLSCTILSLALNSLADPYSLVFDEQVFLNRHVRDTVVLHVRHELDYLEDLSGR